MQNVTDVSTPSLFVAEAESKRALVRALQGGTPAMRAAGERWLPRHPAEHPDVYRVRLEKTFLDNFLGMAIDKATGKLFSKPIKLENIPSQIEPLLENIDRQGRAIDPFIMDVANTAFQDGISYVMADMEKAEGVVTQADEKALGVRPYAIHIKPLHLLEALSGVINGVETLVRVRIRECISVPDSGWGYAEIEQVRVWYRDRDDIVWWELYRQNEKKEWVVVEDGLTKFKNIYLVPFYTNRTGFMMGEPGFQNIAESTLEHWQLKSEHALALSMCCFGMYTATGVDEKFKFVIGPCQTQTTTNVDAKFEILEATGKGVELAEKAITAVESRIESAGVNLRVENNNGVTATAASLDSADTHAALMAIAGGFSGSIKQLLGYFAEMMGIDAPEMEIKVNDDFGSKKGTDTGMQEMTKARSIGDISREEWAANMIWRGEMRPEYDSEEDSEKLDAEGPPLADAKKEPDPQNMDAQNKIDQGATE